MMTIRRFLNCQKGAAAAEMALVAPFAVLLFFTAVESGHYFYSQQQLVKAVRDGARYGARQPFDEVNCRGGSGTVSQAVQDNVRTLSLTGALTGNSERRSGWDNTEVNFTVTVDCPSSAEASDGIYASSEPAAVLQVSATIGYDSLFNGLGIINDNYVLNGTQNAAVMGL